MQTGQLHPGVNITSSQSVIVRGVAIDYHPKARILFCANPRSSCPPGVGHSGPGITLHMFNSSQTLVEDAFVHAAPYMAITSFNGDEPTVSTNIATWSVYIRH